MTRDAEKRYLDCLTPAERAWLRTKPLPADEQGRLHRADAAAMREGAEELMNFCRLLLAVKAAPGERLLDLGGGTGWVARLALRFGLRPLLVDLAPAMCRAARTAEPVAAVPFPVLAADAALLPLAAESVDLCFFNGALHHCPDPAAVLHEVRRVLAPGGRLALCEPGEAHAASPAARVATERYGVTERGFAAEELLHWLAQAGFAAARVVPQLADDFALNVDGLASLKRAAALPAAERVVREVAGLAGAGRGAVVETAAAVVGSAVARLSLQVCVVACR
ncbi:MAG TPA: class I SAM-dependent methyltransferase [bacterium]|nr:class I SAM-dependent methyltransferase [bacterium]